MCMRLLGTPESFKWLGEHIYIGLKLELAVWSSWALFCVGIGISGAMASVLPITHRQILAIGFSDTTAVTSGPSVKPMLGRRFFR